MAIVTKLNASAPIQNGTIVVNGPKGDPTAPTNSNYTINTYATDLPSTGTIDARYNTAFTGCPPCLS